MSTSRKRGETALILPLQKKCFLIEISQKKKRRWCTYLCWTMFGAENNTSNWKVKSIINCMFLVPVTMRTWLEVPVMEVHILIDGFLCFVDILGMSFTTQIKTVKGRPQNHSTTPWYGDYTVGSNHFSLLFLARSGG